MFRQWSSVNIMSFVWKLLVLTTLITALVQDAGCGHISRRRRASRGAPSITSTNKEFSVVEGEDVTLPCKVQNQGRSYVIWKKDGNDLMKIRKTGRQWKIHPAHSSLYKKNYANGDMSLDETSLTLHTVHADDQGKYLCTVENQNIQVQHTLKIIENEDDYYDYDYYENYEDLFGAEDEDKQGYNDKDGSEASVSSTDVEEEIIEDHDKEDNIDEGTERDESVPINENSKPPSDDYDDDYYDYYEDIFDQTQVEDPEEVESTSLPQAEELSTTETPTLAPTPEPTKPARTWSWSLWSSNTKKVETSTTTTEIPTTEREPESKMDSENDEDTYDYDNYYYGNGEDNENIESETIVDETYSNEHDQENTTDDKEEDDAKEHDKENDIDDKQEDDVKEHDQEKTIEDKKDNEVRRWMSWFGLGKEETTTTTVETPTTEKEPESILKSENDQYSYKYDEYDYGYEDEKDVITETNVEGKYHNEPDEENINDNKQEYDDKEEVSFDQQEEKHSISASSTPQVSVGNDGMACLACTLPLPEGETHVQWMHNNEKIMPDGESIVALRDGDMDTLLITSVKQEDLGEYRCIVGEDEAVINLVAFPPKPVYKMVEKNSDGNYQITWEAHGLVSMDEYSITYRERDSPMNWWQQEGPFEVSETSSDEIYSHTFRNLQPYTDYEAIVSTIYQGMATTGDPFPFSVKRTANMYPSSRKPGNGLVRAWMKQHVAASKDQALELVCTMDTKRRTKFLKMRYPVSVDYIFGEHPDIPVIMEPIEVQWFHGKNLENPVENKHRITSYQKGNNNILRFTSVEPSDLGEYRCQGQTSTGIKEATVQLVAFPPPAKKQEITEQDSGIYKLKWESKGLAPVTSFSITYRKTDSTSEGWNQIGPILVNDEENTDDTHSYVFTNLQPSSSYDVIISTIYRDLATTGEPFSFTTNDDPMHRMNDMGQDNVWMEQPVVHVDIGESSQLVCVVDEHQDMQVEWYHGRQKVNSDNNRSISKENNRSILKFMSVSSLDLGTYQCSASNKFGRETVFARLTTADDTDSLVPPEGVLRSEDVTQWWSLTQSIFSDVHKYLKTLTRIPQPTELVY